MTIWRSPMSQLQKNGHWVVGCGRRVMACLSVERNADKIFANRSREVVAMPSMKILACVASCGLPSHQKTGLCFFAFLWLHCFAWFCASESASFAGEPWDIVGCPGLDYLPRCVVSIRLLLFARKTWDNLSGRAQALFFGLKGSDVTRTFDGAFFVPVGGMEQWATVLSFRGVWNTASSPTHSYLGIHCGSFWPDMQTQCKKKTNATFEKNPAKTNPYCVVMAEKNPFPELTPKCSGWKTSQPYPEQ